MFVKYKQIEVLIHILVKGTFILYDRLYRYKMCLFELLIYFWKDNNKFKFIKKIFLFIINVYIQQSIFHYNVLVITIPRINISYLLFFFFFFVVLIENVTVRGRGGWIFWVYHTKCWDDLRWVDYYDKSINRNTCWTLREAHGAVLDRILSSLVTAFFR